MFKPNDRRLATRLAITASALLLPLAAQCGVFAAEPAAAAASAPSSQAAPAPVPRAAEGYQIRCWQFGRLLFEENNVGLPPDPSQFGVKLSGTDRQGRPVHLAETRNATCLIRTSEPRQREYHEPAVK